MVDETPQSENPPPTPPAKSPVDLSALAGFSFGPAWSESKPVGNYDRDDRPPRRDDRRGGPPPRRDGPGGPGRGAPPRRDFRDGPPPPRREPSPATSMPASPASAPAPVEARAPRADFRPAPTEERRGPRPGEFRPAGGPGGDDRRGPRPEYRGGQGGGGGYSGGGQGGYPQGGGYRGERRAPAPFRPTIEATFFPEDETFKRLSKVIKTSLRTFELFDIAQTILEKPDRFVIVLKPLPDVLGSDHLFVTQPEGLPFETEEQALEFILASRLDALFTVETVEVEPPKGNFTVINKCGITGELLGPPNYHRYAAILQAHHAARLAHMPFERFRQSIESVRDPEAVTAWSEKMKKETRYTLKEPPEGQAVVFDNRESARHYLKTFLKEKLVRPVQQVRLNGKQVDELPEETSIRQSLEIILEGQRRFPLDTANHLRGRLRRQNFQVYKRGAKGVSYVCAVKRRLREEGQQFAPGVQVLIDTIEANPEIKVNALAQLILGFNPEELLAPAPAPVVAAPKVAPVAEVAPVPVEAPATTVAEAAPAAEVAPVAEAVAAETVAAVAVEAPAMPVAKAAATPVAETAPMAPAMPAATEPSAVGEAERIRLAELRRDLRWLVGEGYVTEFKDGRLYAAPARPPAKPGQPAPSDDDAPTDEAPLPSEVQGETVAETAAEAAPEEPPTA